MYAVITFRVQVLHWAEDILVGRNMKGILYDVKVVALTVPALVEMNCCAWDASVATETPEGEADAEELVDEEDRTQ